MAGKRIVVLTGAGISAESGIATFRGADGLWEGHDVTEVASPEGWHANRELVLEFYNQRRKNVTEVEPNRGHEVLAELEAHFDVCIITQNIDNLHERAGSSRIVHLHGEIMKSRSTLDENLVYEMDHWELKLGDKCEKGSQLRPHIVWFGEMVPMMETAAALTQIAEILVIVGTSMVVYPAAGLINYVAAGTPIYVVDPNRPPMHGAQNVTFIEEPATTGMERLKQILLNQHL